MKGVLNLDKKQRISWGVSFGSLALVAGMVSYLGLTGGGKTNNQNRDQFGQQPQNGVFSQGQMDPNQNFNNNDQSSQFNLDDGAPNGNSDDNNQFFCNGNGDDNNQPFFGNGNSDNSQGFSNNGGGRGSGRHHGFDTTTGGT